MPDLKTDIHRLVDDIQDEQFLSAVYTILEKQISSEQDFWESLSTEQKAKIKQGMMDADAGRYRSARDVLSKFA